MPERYLKLRDAEDFYYRDDNGLIQTAEKVVLFGGEDQALLNCYGEWVVVKVDAILLPNEVSEEEVIGYYDRMAAK